jgi:hypothetical protein
MTVLVKKPILTIPDSVTKKAGIKVGDRVDFRVSRGRITITTAQRGTYKPTRSEMAAIRRGEAAIARGDHVCLSDFLDGLDRNRRKTGTKASRKVSR